MVVDIDREIVDQRLKAQRQLFHLASNWASGLDMKYRGVDLAFPMVYGLLSSLNQLQLRLEEADHE